MKPNFLSLSGQHKIAQHRLAHEMHLQIYLYIILASTFNPIRTSCRSYLTVFLQMGLRVCPSAQGSGKGLGSLDDDDIHIILEPRKTRILLR